MKKEQLSFYERYNAMKKLDVLMRTNDLEKSDSKLYDKSVEEARRELSEKIGERTPEFDNYLAIREIKDDLENKSNSIKNLNKLVETLFSHDRESERETKKFFESVNKRFERLYKFKPVKIPLLPFYIFKK